MEPPKDPNSADFWKSIYDRTDTPPWDRGESAPALINLLEGSRHRKELEQALALGLPAAVPGCGLGHDLLALARAGFEPHGFDIVEQAVEGAQAALDKANLKGAVHLRDIFTMGQEPQERFGLIYEYTCYCAIDPGRRDEYAQTMRRALAPGGLLVGLFFPYSDDRPEGGPPFAVRSGELEARFTEGFEWLSFDAPAHSHPDRVGLERLLVARRI